MPTTPMCQSTDLDDDKVCLGIEFRAHRADDFVHDAALDLLAFAIAVVERLGNRHGFGFVACEQVQGFLSGFQAAGGIQARRELISDFNPDRLRALRDFLERHQTRTLGGVQSLQASRDEQAIFADQWHDIGNGAQRDEVQQRSQIKIREAGKSKLASAFNEGVREFEGETGGAKLGKRGIRQRFCFRKLRIHQRRCGWGGGRDLMVVQHEDIHTALTEPGDGNRRRSNRNRRPAAAWLETSLNILYAVLLRP